MKPWLVIIDPQVIFADPSSDWASPMWLTAQDNIEKLASVFDQIIVTRWIPPHDPTGSWKDYMEEWTFANVPADDPILELVTEFDGEVVDAPTFGKWTEIREITGENPHLVITGVSTDCCVLSTVLPAADAGAHVTVVSDACAGSSLENHERALGAMSLYPPQVTIRTTDDVMADL